MIRKGYPKNSWDEKDLEDLGKKALAGQKLICPACKQKVDATTSTYPSKSYHIINLSCFTCSRKGTRVIRI